MPIDIFECIENNSKWDQIVPGKKYPGVRDSQNHGRLIFSSGGGYAAVDIEYDKTKTDNHWKVSELHLNDNEEILLQFVGSF